jgi:rubrerythrin
MSKEELIRQIRAMISAEYDAVKMYTILAEQLGVTDELAKKVLIDVADEERVHAGEFMAILFRLAPDETSLYEKGLKEVDDIDKGK